MGDKPKRGDSVFPVHHQRQALTGKVHHVARKWMVVEVPYLVKLPIAQFVETRPGNWVRASATLTWEQKSKAIETGHRNDDLAFQYSCRYCKHGYTGADYYSHLEVEKHLAADHPEELLDLLGGGDG